ncbi:MAG: prepilin-type N-terminal cleavage/methylation domain-containing protein [Pirellulales bacterium]|nr:prepilin-type N-terminal cleavage/methylation domain-containing protein [Pirellulales bacterium]
MESGEQGRRKGEGGRRKDRHAPHSSFIIHHSSFRPVRRAVTLIEMLIVLFIISLLAVMALRALPGEDQRPRETGRMLSVYIATAKNNAAATGRPSGVIFRPSNISTYSGYCTVVEQCEVPPTYAGDMLSAQVMAQDWTYVKDINGPGMVPYCADGRPVIKLLIPANEFPENLIRYGDRIQINGQGPIYTICWDGENQNGKGLFAAPPTTPADFPMVTRNPSADVMSPPPPLLPTNVSNKQWPQEYNFPNSLDKNGNPDPNGYISCLTTAPVNATFTQPDNLWVNNYCVTCYLEVQNSVPLPWPKSVSPMGFFGPNPPTPPISFTIIRQPEKSAAAPLQLPAGAGIDLMASGTENGLILAGNSAIMFSPSGAVDALYINGTPYKLSHTIHLLVGKLTVGGEPNNNYADLKNILVSINPQTGTISTNPVYPPFCVASPGPPPYPNDPPAVQNTFDPANPPAVNYSDNRFVQALFYSRKFAREAQTMGGKR